MEDKKTSRIRYPSTLWVDQIEFDVPINVAPTRTAYELELTEHDIEVLYAGLKDIIENRMIKATRIRFTGRQDFQ